MSAIYQRARPIRWDQVVGQEHVKDVLKAAMEQGRVGHAYLFSGPRGVGKTTTARLIAMTANCDGLPGSAGPGVKPCGECESCMSVRAGNHPDVMEIDAASNNSVDDVRELREKVGLSAMRGGKKIYILDEAHMMSRAAFNALLKTLEEPPEHVIFILATTEPEKIIPTILSRCQHYRFRRLTPEEIAGKLSGIAVKEGVNAEPEALQLIGRLADGAMRDGESLLERMLAAGNAVTRAGVEAALGLPPGEQMRSMAASLVQNDAGGLLGGAASLYRAGYAARTVVEGLVTALGQALYAELGLSESGVGGTGAGRLEGADVPRLLRLQAALDAQDSRFVRGADLQSLELALTHALIAGDGMAGSGGQAATGAAPAADVTQRLARLEKELRDLKASGVPMQPARPMTQPVASALDEIPAFDAAQRAPARSAVQGASPALTAPPATGDWEDVVKLSSQQTRAFLKTARRHAQAGYVSLTYDEKWKFHAKQVISKFEEVSRLVVQIFGPVMLEIIGPTPDSSRRAQVGGKAVTPASSPVPVTAAPSTPAPGSVSPPDPADTIPPFAEARGGRAEPTELDLIKTDADSLPAALSPNADSRAEIPEFAPARKTPARAAAPQASPPRGSLDDRAAAPLPGPAPASAQAHVADAPPLPDSADTPPPPREAHASYIAPEPIFEEPDWDDIGMPFGDGGEAAPILQPARQQPDAPPPLQTQPASLQPASSQSDQAQSDQLQSTQPRPRPDNVQPALVQAAAGQRAPARTAAVPPTTFQPVSAEKTSLQDLRAHPLYQEATRMWAGRVKEVGKVKLKAPDEAGAEADLPEVLAEEELA